MAEAQGQISSENTEQAAVETQATNEEPQYKYTDRDLDKHKGNARKEARSALLKDLGFEKPDDLKAFVEEYRSVQEATKTEADIISEERDKVRNELDKAYAYIAQMKEESALRDALTKAGIKAERIPLALKVVDSDALDVDDDGNITGVDDAVSTLKEQSPEWFGGTSVGRGSSPGTARPISELFGKEKIAAAFNQQR